MEAPSKVCGIQAVQAAWVPQGGAGRGRGGTGQEETAALALLDSASAATTAFLFPGDVAPGLMSSSLQRTKASRDKGHTQADVGESWGSKSRASTHTSWCPQPGQGWSESAISFFSSLSLLVSRFLNFSRLWKIREEGERKGEREGRRMSTWAVHYLMALGW